MTSERRSADYFITPHEMGEPIRIEINEVLAKLEEGMEDFPNALRIIEEKCGEIDEIKETVLTIGKNSYPVLRFKTNKGHRGLVAVPAPIDKWAKD